MIELVAAINDRLSRGEALAAVTIVTNEGSTPRTAGSKMLVFADGSIAGTVGGGLGEGMAIVAAKETLAAGPSRLLGIDMTGQASAGADLICGGRMRVFIERLDPDAATRELFAALAGHLAAGHSCLIVARIGDGTSGRALIAPDGATGDALPPEALEAARKQGRGIAAPICFEAAGASWMLEPALARDPLYIFGGGHVSRPTCHMAAMVGFGVTVFDDRPEFANPERFPDARETLAYKDLAECFAGRAYEENASVVIVTRGHAQDKDALALALRTRAGYIGMIGSLGKRDSVYARLLAEGFTAADIARCHSPIGLSIEAETPEEIAVSIVAELIACRAARRG